MTNNEVKQIFDASFLAVTKQLVRLEVFKMEMVNEAERGDGCRCSVFWEKIKTHGAVNATIICQFPEQLFRYITDTMHGGTSPSEDEVSLYLNEYMNIICGHAISKINNITKTKSRLSVPEFYSEEDGMDFLETNEKKQYLAYKSQYGILRVYLFIE